MSHTHQSDKLAMALIDLVGMLNSPRQDDVLLKEAKVSLDRALFPLLIRIGVAESVSVAQVAESVGRDHSTASRQIAKLESLGLVHRKVGKTDQRVREATITVAGRRLVQTITQARRRLFDKLLTNWSDTEIETLARLNRRLADGMKTFAASERTIVP